MLKYHNLVWDCLLGQTRTPLLKSTYRPDAYSQYHVSGNFDERKVCILVDHFDMHTIAIRCTVHVATGCIYKEFFLKSLL